MSTAITETSDTKICRTLKKCVRACMDGEKGYADASVDVRDRTLKSIFLATSLQRSDFVRALENAIATLGGIPEHKGSLKGAAHRGFTGLRMAVDGRPDSTILAECERGERGALATYDRAFEQMPLDTIPKDVRAMLIEQRAAIKDAHDDILRRLSRS